MESDLFAADQPHLAPLAHRLRPQTFEEFVGQSHLMGPGKFITEIFRSGVLPSLIFWGPPGSGKTTLARLLAQKKDVRFEALSATTSGVREVREVIATASEQRQLHGKRTLLFIDEIHRFNKAQQDALLPHLEDGTFTLVGATTENPSFEIISPLLSRAKVLVLKPLEEADLKKILHHALTDDKRGLGEKKVALTPEAENFLCATAEGDARRLLNLLETSVQLNEARTSPLDLPIIQEALQKKYLTYDKSGEEHYNVISAFIKSMRGSDPDAAVYYLARLLEAGEDPLFVARRMVIFAGEDIGNADPQAVQVAVSCMQSFDFVGMPEGWIPLAQAATYLASAPKSNASYAAYLAAKEDTKEYGALPVPLHLRNAPTKLMKSLDYGKGYRYAHSEKDHLTGQQHLPEKLQGKKYYKPDGIGYEKVILEWLGKAEEKRKKTTDH